MKLRQTRYTPKKRKNRLVLCLDAFLVVAAAVLWLNREKFGLSLSDMLIVSGLVLMALVLASADRQKQKENAADDEYLEKLRENIGKDSYDENIWFFDGGDDKN